jgi:hypothetical protein
MKDVRNDEANKMTAPIFVGGAARSGTTLLRVILDSHPNIACGPELKITPYVAQMWFELQTTFTTTLKEYHITEEDMNRVFAGVLSAFLEKYRKAEGKPRIAEKSPSNIFFFGHLASMFPKSPFVHIIRDGRDVVCSLMTMDWRDPKTGKAFDYTQDVKKAAEYWASAVRIGREAQKDPMIRSNYLEIRYEDLVTDPEKTLKPVFTFIGEPWDPDVLNYYEKKRNLAGESSAYQVSKPLYNKAIGRWLNDLRPPEKNLVKEVIGELLIEIGYAENLDW